MISIIRDVIGWNLAIWWMVGMADLTFYLGRGFLQAIGVI